MSRFLTIRVTQIFLVSQKIQYMCRFNYTQPYDNNTGDSNIININCPINLISVECRDIIKSIA